MTDAQISPETLVILRRLRVQYRDRPAIYRDLLLINQIITAARISPEHGTELAAVPGSPASSTVMTTTEVAKVLGITESGVLKAVYRGDFPGSKRHGRRWLIPIAAVSQRANQAA